MSAGTVVVFRVIWKLEGTRMLLSWIVVDSSELETTGLTKCELVGDKCW